MTTTTFSFGARAQYRSLREESGATHESRPAAPGEPRRAATTGQPRSHVPVMVREVVEALAPKDGEVIVDATYGTGGHSKALRAAADIKLIAIDVDPREAEVLEGNFADLKTILAKQGVQKVDKVLFDLGWNIEQLSGKGFSFLSDEPLSMSYGAKPASGFTALEIVNGWREEVLADVLYGYGQERYARRIAKAMVERRAAQPIATTLELAEIIKDAVPPAYRHGRLHPATKSFQALRIAVNDELRSLQNGLDAAWELLACGGRIAVITFHSLEDRIVKRTFAECAKTSGRLIFKKPLIPSREEIITNPPSRSAKLRVIEKICKK